MCWKEIEEKEESERARVRRKKRTRGVSAYENELETRNKLEPLYGKRRREKYTGSRKSLLGVRRLILSKCKIEKDSRGTRSIFEKLIEYICICFVTKNVQFLMPLNLSVPRENIISTFAFIVTIGARISVTFFFSRGLKWKLYSIYTREVKSQPNYETQQLFEPNVDI